MKQRLEKVYLNWKEENIELYENCYMFRQQWQDYKKAKELLKEGNWAENGIPSAPKIPEETFLAIDKLIEWSKGLWNQYHKELEAKVRKDLPLDNLKTLNPKRDFENPKWAISYMWNPVYSLLEIVDGDKEEINATKFKDFKYEKPVESL